MTGDDYCQRHRSDDGSSPELKQALAELPKSQRIVVRHKCAFCAEELGARRGYELARRQLAAWFGMPVTELPDLGAPDA